MNTIFLTINQIFNILSRLQGKLESYRELEKTGKELSADKKVAILKYDEVTMTLEFSRELAKQIEKIINNTEKDQKKKQKKDETSKKQNETSKIREVLIIQELLKQLKNESVRTDLLSGNNDVLKLEQSDFDLLESL